MMRPIYSPIAKLVEAKDLKWLATNQLIHISLSRRSHFTPTLNSLGLDRFFVQVVTGYIRYQWVYIPPIKSLFKQLWTTNRSSYY